MRILILNETSAIVLKWKSAIRCHHEIIDSGAIPHLHVKLGSVEFYTQHRPVKKHLAHSMLQRHVERESDSSAGMAELHK